MRTNNVIDFNKCNYVFRESCRQSMRALTFYLITDSRSDHAHGFYPGRSFVTNAAQHIGYNFTLKIDVSKFFPSIDTTLLKPKYNHIYNDHILPWVLLSENNCSLPIGLPVSPVISNLSMLDFDAKIAGILKGRAKYTRYADDMNFSFNDYSLYEEIKTLVGNELGQIGLKINISKTRLQNSKFGRRIVTGIAVGEDDIKVTRKMRRKLRVTEHQADHCRNNGYSGIVQMVKKENNV